MTSTLVVTTGTKHGRELLQRIVNDLAAADYSVTTQTRAAKLLIPAKLTARFHGLHHKQIRRIKELLDDHASFQLM